MFGDIGFTEILIIVLVIVIFLFYKHRKNELENKRSLKSLFLGTLITGIIFFFIGLIVGAEIYCIGAKYAECTLGGLFVGGPLSFTLSTGIFYIGGQPGRRRPNNVPV